MENKDLPAQSVKNEQDCRLIMHPAAIVQPVTDITVKPELAAPEDTLAGCPGAMSSCQESTLVDVKHEIGLQEPVWPKSELTWEGTIAEGDMEPWQVYKDGEFIRHIWDAGGRNQSSERANNVNPVIDSSSTTEQPVKHQSNAEIAFEQTIVTNNVNSTFCSSSTEAQAVDPVPAVEMSTSVPGQLFHCELCEFTFEDHYLMERHIRNHMREKRYRCSVCDHSCINKSHLIRHMRTHTGEKPFKCTVCEYRFTQQSNVTNHMRTHTGEKPFKCIYCGYMCVSKRDLTIHMRTHTGEKPFKCTVCEYRCTQQANLTKHMRTHTGELKCNMHKNRCVSESDLSTHEHTSHCTDVKTRSVH